MADNRTVIPGQSYIIQSGDELGKIALSAYGDASRFREIQNANRAKIPNADHIKPGDTIFIPPDKPAERAAEQVAPPNTPPASPKTNIRGKRPRDCGIGYTHQAPNPRIEFYRRDKATGVWNTETPYLELSPYGPHDGLQSLSFSFSVYSLDTQWSATIDDSGKSAGTIFDEIEKFSVVKIYCADQGKPEFIGVLHAKTASTSAPIGHRSIQRAGRQITSLLSDFVISADFAAFGGQESIDNVSKIFAEQFAVEKGLTMTDYIKKTMLAYTDTMKEFISNSDALQCLQQFCGGTADAMFDEAGFDSGGQNPERQKLFYPITNQLFSNGSNSLVQIWRSILPDRLYEIYGRVDAAGKPKAVIRKKPFSPAHWRNLNNVNIYPDVMMENAFSLTQSDEEVYTVFNSYLIGSPFSRDQAIIETEINRKNDIIVKAPDAKVKTYGYRPMEVNFVGYAIGNNVDDDNKNAEDFNASLRGMNKQMSEWYGRLDEFYSGTLGLVYRYDAGKAYEENINPEVGGVIDLLGGQFYVEGVAHRWSFGGPHTLNVQVSRGADYTADPWKPIPDIGRLYNELLDHH